MQKNMKRALDVETENASKSSKIDGVSISDVKDLIEVRSNLTDILENKVWLPDLEILPKELPASTCSASREGGDCTW